MSRVCELTGKRPTVGNTVSHANNKKRRRFLPNLHTQRFWLEGEKRWISLRVSTNALRTIEKNGLDAVVADLRGAGFTVDTVDDPVAWLATHAVFIAGIGAAILRSGDSTTLGRDRAATSQMVLAVRDGFQALSRLGTPVIPTPLKVIFTQVPRLISVPYWQRQLRGELGTLALEPHVLSTRDTEFRMLAEAARELTGWSPILDRHLASAGFSAERPR